MLEDFDSAVMVDAVEVSFYVVCLVGAAGSVVTPGKPVWFMFFPEPTLGFCEVDH